MAETKPTDKKIIPGKGKEIKPAAKKTAVMQPGKPQAQIQQAGPTTSVYKPPPGQKPCTPAPPVTPEPPAPPPPPVEQPILTELLQRIVEEHETFRLILDQLTVIAQSTGTAAKPEMKYYNTPLTAIQVATPVQPNSPDTFSSIVTGNTGYQAEGIYNALQRISPRATVINDGSDTLFVISTADSTNWSTEAPILMGEARTFFNVWELRIRSPAAGDITKLTGGIYRVTEFDFWLAYSTNPNRSQFTAQTLTTLVAGTTISTILGATLQIPNGFALVIRSDIANAVGTFVYVAGPLPAVAATPPLSAVANVAAAATRITLAPGDSVKLFVRNTDAVAILGSVAGLFVDILAEQ